MFQVQLLNVIAVLIQVGCYSVSGLWIDACHQTLLIQAAVMISFFKLQALIVESVCFSRSAILLQQ